MTDGEYRMELAAMAKARGTDINGRRLDALDEDERELVEGMRRGLSFSAESEYRDQRDLLAIIDRLAPSP